MSVKRILLTPGEPAGIGPELAIHAARHRRDYELAAVADPSLLKQAAEALARPIKLRVISPLSQAQACDENELAVIPVALAEPSVSGKLNKANAQYVIDTLSLANDWCMQGKADAVVTGPVQKSIINDAGIAFSGHTEFFADRSGCEKVVMMLATDTLRVALATTHLPLKDVHTEISYDNLHRTVRILHSELVDTFAIEKPRILVCGLNPHAGENGHLGREEIDIIQPVLSSLRQHGLNVIGPLPADTLFTPKYLSGADAVLAMYHDQGLPVLKFQGFGKAVNITLGLPYIRTSVDHGTALDLAGTGKAEFGSMAVAIHHACSLARSRDQKPCLL